MPGRRRLLLGMGNPFLTDDAVGILLARHVATCLGPRPDLEVLEECSIGGLDLLPLLEGFSQVVVLDSIRTGGVPGDWYSFNAAALRETMNLNNVHDANFATSLALGRHLGMDLPKDEDILIFAVEIAENLEFSERLSPEVEAAWPSFSMAIQEGVTRLVEGP